ncbi:MAG: radical SAM protein, partial [Clostridiales bacterium]|nr:radical SAM protein [Clostridiales bacterium]
YFFQVLSIRDKHPGHTRSSGKCRRKYRLVKEKVQNLTVVGIAGPGDALANFEETKKTLELIRAYDPDVTFCLSTNGLMLPQYAQELVNLGVSHVTVTINAVDLKIGARIYKHITYHGMTFVGESAAAILMANQLSGLKMLVQAGVICKVNIVTLKGINDQHIPEIVKTVKDIGCFITNIMPFIQVEGSVFENLEPISNKELNEIRKNCSSIMQQMYHCRQCRADAIGTLDHDRSIEFESCHSSMPEEQKEDTKKYTFAVASKSGMLVDSHFGQVNELYIYRYEKGEAVFVEKRNIAKYCSGEENCNGETDKIDNILKTMEDCEGIIAMRIGEAPKHKLADKKIRVFVTYDKIEDAVKKAAGQM